MDRDGPTALDTGGIEMDRSGAEPRAAVLAASEAYGQAIRRTDAAAVSGF
ncbi:MAG TPA: hypothetical protein VMM35_11420 [Longimicrobiales bacterium]|nr:hypothetical protein [Longimicrobiales bacterium]